MPPRLTATLLVLAGIAALGAAEPPRVVDVAPVAPDILALTIHERTVRPGTGMQPYTAQEGDRIEPKGGKTHVVWRDGVAVDEPVGWVLHRDGEKLDISADHQRVLQEPFAASGEWLDAAAAARAQSWSIASASDATYADGAAPRRVSLKRKPAGAKSLAGRSVVFLHLESPLQQGASYRIEARGLELAPAAIDYVHDTRVLRSEAVHVGHVGFRPDDPAKRGRISIWLGTGGAHDPGAGGPLACELIDEHGRVGWSGEAVRVRRASEGDAVANKRNLAGTDVYLVDFGAHRAPGTWRLHVVGIGCSHPFPIAEDAWDAAVRISLQGLLSHRSGIALDAALIGYERPRPMHPADGFQVFPLEIIGQQGEAKAIDEAFKRLLASGEPLPEPLPEAWGGYMDAGDWDRNRKHVSVSRLLLELYTAHPAFWDDFALVLPDDERANARPDLLDEVRWNLDFFRRLQTAEGGVRSGIESTGHPRGVEASWQESQLAGAFAPDPITSYEFAAAAAHYAQAIAPHDAADAARFRSAAERAWTWAEEPTSQAVLDRLEGKEAKQARDGLPRVRALAATRLLALTADQTYAAAIAVELTPKGDAMALNELAMAYLQLPPELADDQLSATARELLRTAGDQALAFQQGNPWGLAGPTRHLPQMGWVGYLSTPGQVTRALPRAFLATGDERYLAGTVDSCQFGAGANPDNRALTTGLGPDPIEWPLHIDSQVTGQAAPPGITIYGGSDPANDYGFEKWVYQWYVGDKQATPAGKQWPMAEAVWDIQVAPSINEYTVHQTIAPTAYTWGVLAARGR